MDGLKIVPQIFYDLIGRVIPGGVAIFAFATSLNLKVGEVINKVLDGTPALQQSSFVLTMIFLIAAYIIGHLIVPLSHLLSSIMSRFDVLKSFHILEGIVSEDEKIKKRYSKGPLKGIKDSLTALIEEDSEMEKVSRFERSNRQYTDIIFLWYDRLRMENADIGDRLTKLRAEHEMHRALAVVLFTVLLLHPGGWELHRSGLWSQAIPFNIPLMIVAFIGFILSAWGMAKTSWRFQMSTIQHYHIERKLKRSVETRAAAHSGGK
jgi:hypothetical protein